MHGNQEYFLHCHQQLVVWESLYRESIYSLPITVYKKEWEDLIRLLLEGNLLAKNIIENNFVKLFGTGKRGYMLCWWYWEQTESSIFRNILKKYYVRYISNSRAILFGDEELLLKRALKGEVKGSFEG